MASCKQAFKVAKSTKPHTIAEALIKTCVLEIAATIRRNEARKRLQKRIAIHKRIAELC